MNQAELANSSKFFRGEKGSYRLEIQLTQPDKQGVLKLTIQNTQTNHFYSSGLNKIEITQDKALGNIFRGPQELYQELVSGFQEIAVQEQQSSMLMRYEVKVGKFRKEPICLELQRISQKGAQSLKASSSPPQSKKRVFIDKAYARDLITFKEDFNKICDKIANKEFLAKINVNNDRNNRIKIKNVFIAFANTILRSYRKSVQFTEIQTIQEQYSTQPPNKLLVQKNELLENILLKAIRRIRQTPTQEIEIDFMPEIPNELLVLCQDGRDIQLSKYLSPFPMDQIQQRIKFHEKRQEKINNCFDNLYKKKRSKIEELKNLFQGQRRSNRLSMSGKKSNFEPDQFDEF